MSMPHSPIRKGEYLIRIDEVLKRVPVSRSSFYAGIRSGQYPQPRRVGKRSVAWLESEIDQLIADFKLSSILPQ
jgi:prophage regulatory protein